MTVGLRIVKILHTPTYGKHRAANSWFETVDQVASVGVDACVFHGSGVLGSAWASQLSLPMGDGSNSVRLFAVGLIKF